MFTPNLTLHQIAVQQHFFQSLRSGTNTTGQAISVSSLYHSATGERADLYHYVLDVWNGLYDDVDVSSVTKVPHYTVLGFSGIKEDTLREYEGHRYLLSERCIDAEKDGDDPTDDNLCWAASAANLLTWEGLGGQTAADGRTFSGSLKHNGINGYNVERVAFDWFKDNFDDHPGLASDGIQAYANAHGQTVTQTYHFAWGYNSLDSTSKYGSVTTNQVYDTGAELIDNIVDAIEAQHAVSLAVRMPFSNHALTAMGVRFDENGDPCALLVADSDNNQYGKFTASLGEQDMYEECAIEWNGDTFWGTECATLENYGTICGATWIEAC